MDMNVPRELLIPATPGAQPTAPSTEFFFSEQLSALYDREQHSMWLRWNPRPRPNFNPELLQDLDSYCQFMAHSGGAIACQGERTPLDYAPIRRIRFRQRDQSPVQVSSRARANGVVGGVRFGHANWI